MKKNWRKYLAVLCAVSCMGLMTGCGDDDKEAGEVTYNASTEEYMEQQMKMYTYQGYGDYEDVDAFAQEQIDSVILYLEQNYIYADREIMEERVEEDKEYYKTEASYLDATESLGEYEAGSAYDLELTMDDESMDASGMLKFEERDVKFTLNVDGETSLVTVSFEKDLTLGEILAKAGMNTLLGMGTVFVVLILISAIISCFKYIGSAGGKKEEPAPVVPQPVAVVPAEEEDVTDDLELVAVISAAIAAAEGTSAEGLVVRSIKRVNRTKWREC